MSGYVPAEAERPWWLMSTLAPERPRTAPPVLDDTFAPAPPALPPQPPAQQQPPKTPPGERTPRSISPGLPLRDKIFHGVARGIGFVVLGITGGIGLFLALQAVPTFHTYKFSFFTTQAWNPAEDKVGIAGVLTGTILIASVALIIAFPLAFATALYITNYAPVGLRRVLVSLVDLMAAIPSIVFGLWGRDLIQPHAVKLAHWINTYFGWIPIFKVNGDPHSATPAPSNYTGSAFIAGIAVSMMVMPMACAVMREVFSQTPPGEMEAALALGATRWDVVRSVVIPFGRGGIIGGSMLSLGRALGETIAVVLILQPTYVARFEPLRKGSSNISSLIAGRFPEAGKPELHALLTAGFVLFIITLIVNTIASRIVQRGRSGASTDI